MPCYSPLTGYRSREINENGKRKLVFNPEKGYIDLKVTVPCGQCIGCRLERSRQWAMRCVHEASLYNNNSFITLTYSQENLPENNSLDVKHFQDFMKRLRKKYNNKTIRFFHCGEYGTQNNRPHYHACLFNHDFEDKLIWQIRDGVKLYTSETLQKLWPQGFSTIGDVTFESAAYVARYIMKKITGEKAEKHYQIVEPTTGEIFDLKPEYTTMSRRPGIGMDWYNKYREDTYKDDFIIMRGMKMQPPKFYDNIYEIQQPEAHLNIKKGRKRRALKNKKDNTPERLLTKEKVKQAQLKQLKRNIED